MWLFLSLGTAFFAGTSDALSKHLVKTHRPSVMAFVKALWGSFFLCPLIYFSTPPSDLKLFFLIVIIAIPLEVMGALLFNKALQVADLSTSIPFMAFTPVFLIGTGWVFLGETATIQGITGIVLVTGGAFLVTTKTFGYNKSNNTGALLILSVAFIYSITAILAKKALLLSSPLFFSATYYPMIALGLWPVLVQRGSKLKDSFSSPGWFAILGLCEALSFLIQFHAFLHVNIAYVVAIKRLSLLLAMIYGRSVFKEKISTMQIVGGGLMVSGAVLISIAG